MAWGKGSKGTGRPNLSKYTKKAPLSGAQLAKRGIKNKLTQARRKVSKQKGTT